MSAERHNQHPKERLLLTPNFNDLTKLNAGHHTRIGAWRRLCYAETKPSLRHAGHSTTLGSSSSNHERPHSQRILYIRCAVTAPNSSSWTSIPLSVSPLRRCARATGTLDGFLVAVCGGTTFRLSRRPSWRKLPRWVLRSFTTKTPLFCVFRTGWWRHGSKRIPLASRQIIALTLLSLC